MEKYKVNIIDTPGDSNFLMDTKYSMRIADSVIVVVDAVGGVEFQTERVWRYADELSLPRMVYISRMDRERANFFKTVDDINNKLGKKTTVCYLPVGSEESFKGVIDLANMKALIFDNSSGKPGKEDIPEDLLEDAKAYRETMVEDIAECDEELMDKYLEEGELSIDDIQNGLRKGVASGNLIPVICGSALNSIGIIPLMDIIVTSLPPPWIEELSWVRNRIRRKRLREHRMKKNPFPQWYSRLLPIHTQVNLHCSRSFQEHSHLILYFITHRRT